MALRRPDAQLGRKGFAAAALLLAALPASRLLRPPDVLAAALLLLLLSCVAGRPLRQHHAGMGVSANAF